MEKNTVCSLELNEVLSGTADISKKLKLNNVVTVHASAALGKAIQQTILEGDATLWIAPAIYTAFMEEKAQLQKLSKDTRVLKLSIVQLLQHCDLTELTYRSVFDFCWKLFVTIRAIYADVNDDLVHCLHLMLSIIDFCYAQVWALDVKNGGALLAPSARNMNESLHEQEPSVLSHLCGMVNGVVGEAKRIKAYRLLPKLKELVGQKWLLTKGLLKETKRTEANDKDSGSSQDDLQETRVGCILSADLIGRNCLLLDELYGTMVETGPFVDERIFLDADQGASRMGISCFDLFKIAKILKCSPEKCQNKPRAEYLLRRGVQACLEKVGRDPPSTPLSGRHYLPHATPDARSVIGNVMLPTLVTGATDNVRRLLEILADKEPDVGPKLAQLFEDCPKDPTEFIVGKIAGLVRIFEDSCARNSENVTLESASEQAQYAKKLYFSSLEKILELERAKIGVKDLENILMSEMFHASLFVCCLEIVMFAFNSSWTFPIVLDIFKMPAFNFYKVIEVLIRSEDQFPREIVKHLNRIEERILEELAWEKSSPLWQAIGNPPNIPAYVDVALPAGVIPGPSPTKSLITPHGLRGRFAPTPAIVSSVAKRRLCFDEEPTSSSGSSSQPEAKYSLQVIKSEDKSSFDRVAVSIKSAGRIKLTPIDLPVDQPIIEDDQTGSAKTDDAPLPPDVQVRKSFGALGLFYRKVYALAHVRLKDLCERLDLDEHIHQRVWTLVEWIMRNESDLLMDRHLDQIIMPSLYVISKVFLQPTGLDKSFQEIMRNYRLQPQAKSRVYRNVLLLSYPKPAEDGGVPPDTPSVSSVTQHSEDSMDSNSSSSTNQKLRSLSTMPVPGVGSAPPTPTPIEEERGDLIRFYNQVFVKRVSNFVRQFATMGGDPESNLTLSPLPKLTQSGVELSPRKKVGDSSIYVSPLKNPPSVISPGRPLQYSFNRSPYKELDAINKMLRRGSQFANFSGTMKVKNLRGLSEVPGQSDNDNSKSPENNDVKEEGEGGQHNM